MRFERLRLVGFKSFVEPAEFVIEPGLTGVVGPNGCGKSNLVEALSFVMGEMSYRNMRASEMDDVIFSGSDKRPARHSAEVTLVLFNDGEQIPAAFSGSETLEVTRRITRQAGSTYRINGREARARDVQLLFADASTGAHSPALVRQGQIGELIAAKPFARRLLIEEAAGISGLHTRRQEAESRIRATMQNLTRLEDVIKEIDVQLGSLGRQARQAERYRALSADIRRHEATLAFLHFLQAEEAVAEATQAKTASFTLLADRQAVQAACARAQALSAHDLPVKREAADRHEGALRRLTLEAAALEAEERQVRERIEEVERRLLDMAADRVREARLREEGHARLLELAREKERLAADEEAAPLPQDEMAEVEAAREKHAGAEEERLQAALAALAAARAERAGLLRACRAAEERLARVHREGEALFREEARAPTASADEGEALTRASQAVAAASEALNHAEQALLRAQEAREMREKEERSFREVLNETEKQGAALAAEARTLARMIDPGPASLFSPLIDHLQVPPGYEAALGAALGDDLDTPIDEKAPAHWSDPGPRVDDSPLPEGVKPLLDIVKGPALLTRRLMQTGVVTPEEAARLRLSLKPGQRLVSVDGDVWRWDGYVAAKGAPTAATRRLAARNRLAEIEAAREEKAREITAQRGKLEAAQGAALQALNSERAAREAVRAASIARAERETEFTRLQREMAAVLSRREAFALRKARFEVDANEAGAALAEAEAALAALPSEEGLAAAVEEARAGLGQARHLLGEVRALRERAARETALRQQKRDTLSREEEDIDRRLRQAAEHEDALEARHAALEAEKTALEARPDALRAKLRQMRTDLERAAEVARAAGDALARAEKEKAEADRLAMEALKALGDAREEDARAEERMKAARARRDALQEEIAERFAVGPFDLAALAGLSAGGPLPDAGRIEAALHALRADRERLGGVNLNAGTEFQEISERRQRLEGEHEELAAALQRLRQAIQQLNGEARTRLLEAFSKVNSHFERLFTHLFGGGAAGLHLIDAEDPLEAGLEIIARPPGKKPQVLTLLSGGEQTLTALALIFAVFLTSPAPICVLDEVDAPLDDANVERYCALLEEMTRLTKTRFLVITHNPITMARMNRLFGVTMAERGVSQLVSVDLEAASRFRDRG